MSWLLDESCQISSNDGHLRVEGQPPQALSKDASMVPEPVPEHAMTCDMIGVIDELNCEFGATLVLPGSHKRRAHPNPGAHMITMPREAPIGSIAVFSSNLVRR